MTGKIIPAANIIEVRQGDTFVIRLCFKRHNQNIDLSKSQIVMQVRDKNSGELMFSLDAEPVDASSGIFAFVLTPAQTGLEAGEYVTDMQITAEDGTVNTFFPANVNQLGVFRVTKQVTK